MTRRNKFIILGTLVVLGLLGISLPFWYLPGPKQAAAYDKTKLIRFHVIANSDTAGDQALKRKIRDLIVAEMTPKFEQSVNVDEARVVVRENLGHMEEIARQEIARWGKDYQVHAMLGQFYFPVKNYGDITLPAGQYEAVRVVIGEGQGANWWCVLFPPVCFQDVNRVAADISAEEDTVIESGEKTVNANKATMANKLSSDDAEDIKVHFKLVEMMKKSSIGFLRNWGNKLEKN